MSLLGKHGPIGDLIKDAIDTFDSVIGGEVGVIQSIHERIDEACEDDGTIKRIVGMLEDAACRVADRHADRLAQRMHELRQAERDAKQKPISEVSP